MPAKVSEVVKPISIVLGCRIIAITAYVYHYCDNDSYNEWSISIVTTKSKSTNWGTFSLFKELINKDLWGYGYMLKRPVYTELARIRDVVGYTLPKWGIPMTYENKEDAIKFDIFDESGKSDISLEVNKLNISFDKSEMVRPNFVSLNVNGALTHGYSDIRAINKASSSKQKDISLKLTDGLLSEFIKSLDLEKLIKYDYQPEFQAALYTPELLDVK